jgi:hypothetical protein
MAQANKVQASSPINQTGAYGYLLWLRRDLPPVYSAAVQSFPDVANFEAALVRNARGLGQDEGEIDLSDVTDLSTMVSPPEIELTLPDIEPEPITVPAPELPSVAVPTDSSGAISQAAANVGPSTLASIATAVAAIVPAALKVTSAVINNQTASKTLATAQLQYAAATAGRAPYQTGIVTTPSGVQYLAPIAAVAGGGSAIAQSLETNLMGLPLWAWGLGALALLFAIVE